MSNSKLLKPFDDMCCIQNALEEQTDLEFRAFLQYARHNSVNDIQRKIALMEETNARMRKDLESALKRKEQLEHHVTNATLMLKNEKKENKRAQQRRDRMRQKLDNLANHVMESRDIPECMKDAVTEKLATFDRIATIHLSSDSDASAVACSCSDTESDNWHLFPGCSKHSSIVSSIHLSVHSSTTATTSSSDCSNNSIVVFSEIWDSIKNRPHEFKSKIVVLGENCVICDLRLQCGHHAQKCISCKAIIHEKCRDQLPKPCIPAPIIKRNSTDLKDFCPSSKPMIPGIIFHSVYYIETEGLNIPGLYGLHVYDPDVKRLHDKFYKGRGVPNLNKYNVHVVATFLKQFFASLNPPLVPGTHFQKLVKHVKNERKENPSYDDLMEDLFLLPNQNRDTLAFLILHLQKVASSPNCKMNSYMVSKTFTPILVENFNSKTFSEEKLQRKVIQQFIDMPEDIWKRVLFNSCA